MADRPLYKHLWYVKNREEILKRYEDRFREKYTVEDNSLECWNYFFDNKGRCPHCRESLIPAVGCINLECFSNIGLVNEKHKKYSNKSIRRIQVLDIAATIKKYKRDYEEYNKRNWNLYLKKMESINGKNGTNIDNASKKSYSKNI